MLSTLVACPLAALQLDKPLVILPNRVVTWGHEVLYRPLCNTIPLKMTSLENDKYEYINTDAKVLGNKVTKMSIIVRLL